MGMAASYLRGRGNHLPRIKISIRRTTNAAQRALGEVAVLRAVQRSIHDAHGEDCTDAAEGNAMPTI